MPIKDLEYFHISTWTMVRFLAILLGLTVVYIIRDILASLFFAIIVASAIEPAIEWLKRYRVPRILGVILIYLSIGAVLTFAVYLIFPLVFEELRNFSFTYPAFEQQVEREIQRADFSPFSSLLGENLDKIIDASSQYLETIGTGITSFASAVFGGIFSFILIIVFSLYLAAQEKGIDNFIRLIIPLQHEQYAIDLWQRSQRTLGRWLRAQMLLGAIVGIFIFFGLTFLGVKQALFFAILAALFEIVPVVGPILAAIPAVATAFLTSPLIGILTIALYVVVQQTESHVIIPVVMRKAVGLSPLIVVLALLIGGKLGGIFGLLLAVPITAIFAEFLSDWDKRKRALMPE